MQRFPPRRIALFFFAGWMVVAAMPLCAANPAPAAGSAALPPSPAAGRGEASVSDPAPAAGRGEASLPDLAPANGEYTLRANVMEVRIAFAASDRQGRVLRSLRSTDVAVADNGSIIRHFRSFRPAAESPLDLVLLLDASESVASQLPQEIAAVKDFIDHSPWGTRDRVSLLIFGGQRPQWLCALRCQREPTQIPAAAGNAALPAAGAKSGNAALPAAGAKSGNAALPAAGAKSGNAALPAAGAKSGNATLPAAGARAGLNGLRAAGATPLYDALLQAAESLQDARDPELRPAIVLFSDGVDTISRNSLPDALEAAQNLQAAIYTVASGPGNSVRGLGVLAYLAAGTGGLSLNPAQDIGRALREVLDDLHGGYVLTYDLPALKSGKHSVRLLATSDPRLTFRSRQAYDDRSGE